MGIRYRIVVFIVAAGLALFGTANAATLFFDDFNDGNADGWQVDSGTWSVIDGQYHQTDNRNLNLLLSASVYAGADFTDFTLEADISTTTGNSPSGRNFGLIFRYVDPDNFYQVVYHPDYSNGAFRLEQVVNGSHSAIIGNTNINFQPSGAGGTLKIKAEENFFEVYFRDAFHDEVFVFDWTDTLNRFPEGKIGVRTGDASGIFDNVRVTGDAVPVPAAVWLIGPGLIGIIGVRRRADA